MVRELLVAKAFAPLDELRAVAYQTDGVFGTYVRLLSPEGEVLYRSPNFEDHSLLPVRIPRTPGGKPISRVWEGKPARSDYTRLTDEAGALRGWLEVTGFEWSLHQELYRLRLAMFIGIVAIVVGRGRVALNQMFVADPAARPEGGVGPAGG